MGRSDLLDLDDAFEKFRAQNVSIHPNYDGDSTVSNLMLVKLDGMASYSPAELNGNSTVPSAEGEELTAIGFGGSGPMGDQNILEEVAVNYIPNADCEELMDPSLDISLEGETGEDNICADAPGTAGICTGDFGGPLIKLGGTADEDLVVGVVAA